MVRKYQNIKSKNSSPEAKFLEISFHKMIVTKTMSKSSPLEAKILDNDKNSPPEARMDYNLRHEYRIAVVSPQ